MTQFKVEPLLAAGFPADVAARVIKGAEYSEGLGIGALSAMSLAILDAVPVHPTVLVALARMCLA